VFAAAEAANTTPLTTIGVSGSGMFSEVHPGCAENTPFCCDTFTARIAPACGDPLLGPAVVGEDWPATGTTNQRGPFGAVAGVVTKVANNESVSGAPNTAQFQAALENEQNYPPL